MNPARPKGGVRRQVAVGVVKAAIGSLLVSIEFFGGTNHGFRPVSDPGSLVPNLVALCVYGLGFLLIYSAIKNCPYTEEHD